MTFKFGAIKGTAHQKFESDILISASFVGFFAWIVMLLF